jgi:hypothetical protein
MRYVFLLFGKEYSHRNFQGRIFRAGIAAENPQRPKRSERREDLQRIARPERHGTLLGKNGCYEWAEGARQNHPKKFIRLWVSRLGLNLEPVATIRLHRKNPWPVLQNLGTFADLVVRRVRWIGV